MNRLYDKPVINSNGRILNLKAYSDLLAQDLKQHDAIVAKSPAQVNRSRDFVIREFLMESMVQDYATKSGISISKEELEKGMNDIRGQYPDDLAFRKSLAEDNVSMAAWKTSTEKTLLQEKVFALFRAQIARPTDEELRIYFEANKEKFKRNERLFLRQIVVDDLTKASELKEALKKKDFIAMAKQYSITPEGPNGGLVGWVEKGNLEVFDKVFSVGLGMAANIIESPYGFHIIRVEKKQPAGTRPLEEVKSLIERLIVGERAQKNYTEWLDKQLRDSKVSIDYDLIRSLKIETRVQEW